MKILILIFLTIFSVTQTSTLSFAQQQDGLLKQNVSLTIELVEKEISCDKPIIARATVMNHGKSTITLPMYRSHCRHPGWEWNVNGPGGSYGIPLCPGESEVFKPEHFVSLKTGKSYSYNFPIGYCSRFNSASQKTEFLSQTPGHYTASLKFQYENIVNNIKNAIQAFKYENCEECGSLVKSFDRLITRTSFVTTLDSNLLEFTIPEKCKSDKEIIFRNEK